MYDFLEKLLEGGTDDPEKEVQRLRKLYQRASSQAATLHFECFNLKNDNQRLEWNLAAAKSQIRLHEDTIQRLRNQIERLKENGGPL